ncbi:MAG: hypothetical protein M1833_001303 [Piccolia ochrophora]|nr:MAG: hypothetical protein M1833_001303 [Piccolia ochrophora]
MAILSGPTIIRALSLFHLTLGYFFLTAPQKVADQNLVFILGEAMGLPQVESFNSRSGPAAMLGAVLALVGVSDLLAVSLPEEVFPFYWGNQAYSYLSKPARLGSLKVKYQPGAGEDLTNAVIFTWAFLEVITWFWIFVTLRDERRELAIKALNRQKAEDASR